MSPTRIIQRVLQQERHRLRQPRLLLLHITKPRDALAIEQVALAITKLDMRQRSRPMAHGADDLVRGVELVDELVARFVVGEVEHRPVAADEEDGFVLVRVPEERGELVRVFPDGLFGLQEFGGDGV